MTNTKADDVAWASATGTDAFGRWAELTVAGVVQRFRWIAPGSFLMGSPEGEVGRWPNEVQHRVKITKGYWLADTPVTQAMWRAVMVTEPSWFRGDRRPVERVSWDDAMAFCAAVNARVPGLALSLPTEAEWERACRAGTTTATWAGDLSGEKRAPELDGIAWYCANSGDGTHEVGTRMANPWGLHDMLGNVFEWCADAWVETLPDAADPLARGGSPRVVRGGSWNDAAAYVRAAYRDATRPFISYCTTVGDEPVAWEAMSETMRAGYISGVRMVLAGETPEKLHTAWMKSRVEEGWTFGPVKNTETRQHPCLVPYEELPETQRRKDALFWAVVRAMAEALQ